MSDYKILNTIKYNSDILLHYRSLDKFLNIIKEVVSHFHSFYLKSNNVNDIKYDLYKFMTGFKNLLEQDLEYFKLDSVLGLTPTKTDYSKLIDKSSMLDFLEIQKYKKQNILKDDISRKLKIFNFDDLANLDSYRILGNLLSLDIELIELFYYHINNKNENIKTGCDKDMTDMEFAIFINKNKVIEKFVSASNRLTIKDIRDKLIKKYDAESFIDSHRINISYDLISSSSTSKILLLYNNAAIKIFSYIFPNKDEIFINKRAELLNTIPITKKYNKMKPRVFFINAHGRSCSIDEYQKINRVDISGLVSEFNENPGAVKPIVERPYFDHKKMYIISNQPVGRLSLQSFINVYNEIFSSNHRNQILKSLISAITTKHLQLIQSLFNIYVYKDVFGIRGTNPLINGVLNDNDLEQNVNDFENTKQLVLNGHSYIYPKTGETTQEYINFVKYNYKHPPPDTIFNFNDADIESNIFGIFELNGDTEPIITKLTNKIINIRSISKEIKMGLKLNSLFKQAKDIPDGVEEVLKYNRAINKLKKGEFTHGELIQIILENANIKEDEYPVIFTNQCRAFRPESYLNIDDDLMHLNTYENYKNQHTFRQNNISKLRMKSMNNSLRLSSPYNISKKNSNNN